MRIQQMTPEVAECVAAGEVIARPASVVKELLENSADATSSSVLLEVVAGGHELIRLSDDGVGIHPDDLLLSLQSHTTSKLTRAEDLNSICTYGFRGEALASIRAVSRLTLASATEDGKGLEVEASGDRIGQPRPIDMPRGTRVQVRDLFASMPARRKFLATPGTEFRHIRRVFQRFALARPEMAMEFRSGGRKEFTLDPARGRDELLQRLVQTLGGDWKSDLVPLQAESAGMQLFGWMGNPDKLQSRPLHQYFIINDRPVMFDKLISSAVRASLGSAIGRHGHPLLAVWLQVQPAHLDVNVHPAKEEVKFLYPRAVHGLVRDAVAQALQKRTPSRQLQVRTGSTGPTGQVRQPIGSAAATSLWVESEAPTGTPQSVPAATTDSDTDAPQPQSEALEHMRLGRPLAHLQGIFILAENSEGLVIVDAHAAHERCLLEKARQQMDLGKLAVQPMLTPLQLEVGTELAEVAEEQQEKLASLGLDVGRVGQDSVLVRAAPSLLAKLDLEELVRTCLAELAETGSSQATPDAIWYLVGNLCCRAATRAGINLSMAEMDELLRAMERLPHSAYCNHGRPSWHQVGISELNRLCHRGR